MNSSVLDTTWGPPVVEALPLSSGSPFRRISDSTKSELDYFLTEEIRDWHPDLLVVVERRGTAILRALLDSPKCSLKWPWSQVISSRVLDQQLPEFYRGKRILIFDDMKRRGSHIHRVLQKLSEFESGASVLANTRVAVFAMHEDATNGSACDDFGVEHRWYLRGLTTEAYRNKRLQIIGMLQESGSLMLDTEHIEIRVRLKGSLPEFVDALRRRANVVAFRSLAGRHNLTVFYDDRDEAHALPEGQLPPGSQLTGIVKKCRVIERGGNEFAVLPISYPSIPDADPMWQMNAEDLALFGEGAQRTPFGAFYATALLAGLSVLEWVLKSVYAAGGDVASVFLPGVSRSEASFGAYSLEHLRVMYPTLSLERLQERLVLADARAAQQGAALRRRSASKGAFEQPDQPTMDSDAWHLLQLIRFSLDETICEERTYDPDWTVPTPFGLSAKDVFRLGERLGFKPWYTSSLFDLLIDNGHLVTHIAPRRRDTDRKLMWTRVFEPDGEMVSDLVRIYTSQHGLPRGF